jgi:Zn-finger nucleic acid-binding protein
MSEAPVEGVTADVCATHGVWLDKGELAAIVGNVEKAQEKRAKRVVRQAALNDLAQRGAHRERAFLGGVWATYFLGGR